MIYHKCFEQNIYDVSYKHSIALSSNSTVCVVLIHSPLKTNEDNVRAFLHLKKIFHKSKVGVSNFDIEKVQYLIGNGCKPDLLSIEFHPYYQPLKLIQFCKNSGITVTGYRTFAKGQVFNDVHLNEIAIKHNVSIMDVVLAWYLLHNVIPTVSSSKIENIDRIAKFSKNYSNNNTIPFDMDDIEKISSLNKNSVGSTCMTKFCKHDD
jgi:diketogulonate reductase-like aldo/keto reductase